MILTESNFVFKGAHHLQTHETAMRTRIAPSYASIFMGDLGESFLNGVDKRPDVWWRYIDDVFAIWPFEEGCLMEFFNYINSMHPTIKFTDQWSSKSITFLDVTITLDQGRLVRTFIQNLWTHINISTSRIAFRNTAYTAHTARPSIYDEFVWVTNYFLKEQNGDMIGRSYSYKQVRPPAEVEQKHSKRVEITPQTELHW